MQLAHALRARLSYASYKAKNNMQTLTIDDVERADELLRPVLAGAVLVVDAAVATEFAEAYARATRKELFEDASRDGEELREQVAAGLRAWQAIPLSAANKAARQQAKDAVSALRVRLNAAEEELLHVRRECESFGFWRSRRIASRSVPAVLSAWSSLIARDSAYKESVDWGR